ncbi:NrfD/PsrC family molybdoenzyme membrane anchor subunit [uncultured Adlercreutzia sp.]|uniref:NrfD/PsrC family molybdoenzyme membrane anchor subunit n=1 Tax=uncultured Adlercreutzia sp. TaxID=875803 RepID=UPI0026F407CC|nr:NrfD/PsrC family molybdoenzyme membrane anchor subunit [uncultured Adlercreutzia sp.]
MRLFGELVIAYLFLAGLGAGGTVAASLADLLLVREPFGAAARPYDGKTPAERLVALVFAASLGAVGLGIACLVLDVGRTDRVLALFLAPRLSVMVVGAWALAALGAALAALTLARFLYLPWVPRRAVAVLEVAACVAAVVVAVYAGLLLQMNAGVRLWSTPWVPVLFVLSAASCGCALMLACGLFVGGDGAVARIARAAVGADAAVIALEVVAAAFFLAFVLESDHPGVEASAASLMGGVAALPWWIGFGVCGIVAPLAIEGAYLVRRWAAHQRGWGLGALGAASMAARSPAAAWALALSAALVFAGSAGLRAAIVEAGAQRPLELQPVSAQAAEAAQGEEGAPAAPENATGAETQRDPDGADRAPEDEREDISTWLS